MTERSLVIGLDLSCLLARPLTGVGYYTASLLRAAMAQHRDALQWRLFATGARAGQSAPAEALGARRPVKFVPWPTRLKIPMWTRLEWPPIEWFTGPVDVAHGAFHLLPPSRKAARVVTVFDLTAFRQADTHTAASTRLHRPMLEHAVRRADALIAISQSCKRDLVELLDADARKVHVVYGGVELEEFAQAPDPAALEKLKRRLGIARDYFIHLGTLEPRKNLPRLIEAYARVRAANRDCPQLLLAGRKGWKVEPIFEAIAAHGLADDVIHTDYLARHEAVALLQGARACLYPSLYEGFGLPVLEAMAARVPVLTSNVSSLPEVAGDTALLVNPEDTGAIAHGIETLLEGDNVARVAAAFERAQSFTWARSAEALLRVYRGVRPAIGG